MKEYKYIINGNEYAVNIEHLDGNKANVTVNGKPYDVEIVGNQVKSASPAKAPAAAAPKAATAAAPAATSAPKAAAAAPKAAGAGSTVKAPLPGTINDIKAAVGQQVKEGDVVIILEAMKMENEITAEASGTITAISVQKGDTVMEGAPLFTVA